MEPPAPLRSAADGDEDVTITQRNYDDETVLVVDFGQGVNADLDIVGDTAIVVVDDRQFEFEVPPEATDITVNDGILEIRSE